MGSCVCYTGVVLHQHTHLRTHSLQIVHICVYVYMCVCACICIWIRNKGTKLLLKVIKAIIIITIKMYMCIVENMNTKCSVYKTY